MIEACGPLFELRGRSLRLIVVPTRGERRRARATPNIDTVRVDLAAVSLIPAGTSAAKRSTVDCAFCVTGDRAAACGYWARSNAFARSAAFASRVPRGRVPSGARSAR